MEFDALRFGCLDGDAKWEYNAQAWFGIAQRMDQERSTRIRVLVHAHSGAVTVIGDEIRLHRDAATVRQFSQPVQFRVAMEDFVDRGAGQYAARVSTRRVSRRCCAAPAIVASSPCCSTLVTKSRIAGRSIYNPALSRSSAAACARLMKADG